MYKEHIISEVHAVGRSLCYGYETWQPTAQQYHTEDQTPTRLKN